MKRIVVLALALAAMGVVSGMAASASMATICVRTDNPGEGTYLNAICTEPGTGTQANWTQVKRYMKEYLPGQWCAEVENGVIGPFTDSECKTKGTGSFAKVFEHPDWYVNGTQLKTGAKQIKLQLKGSAFLKSPLAGVEIECKNSISEGATIEGSGFNQGQDKGRVTYTQCTVLKPAKAECTVAWPITTNPLKSYLATANTQTKLVDVYEPTEGKVFVELKFSKGCGEALSSAPVGIIGSIAAELIPSEVERQEGLVAFPATAIGTVNHEGVEKKLKLEILGDTSTFSGAYGARLAGNEPFGVFGSN